MRKHMLVCAGLIATGLIAALAGWKGLGAVVSLACPLAMAAMLVMMVRHGAKDG
jgi:hypothetical protein